MSKPPVSLLQELLVKSNMVPNFELIFDGTDTQKPIFKYMATAGCHTAMGTGRSKQEAKQYSAKMLLAVLKSNNSYLNKTAKKELPEEVQFPYAEAIKDNAIGALQEFCSSRRLNRPIYELIKEGSPHCKIYDMRCTVSSFCTEGQAQTKKQAKQLSAKLMLDKLKSTIETLVEVCEPPPAKIMRLTPQIVEAYKVMRQKEKPSSLANHVDMGFEGLHQFIKEFVKFKPSSTLEEMTNYKITDIDGLSNPKEKLCTMLNELQFQLYEKTLSSKAENVAVVAVEIKGPAKWTFLGCSPSQPAAFRQAFISALMFLAEMSS